MVLLITASAEKFRSVYHKNYPKNQHEGLFSWLCAGTKRLPFVKIGARLMVRKSALDAYIDRIEEPARTG